jgi:hypothetical protein
MKSVGETMNKNLLIFALIALLAACGQARTKNDNNVNNNVELRKSPVSVGMGTLDVSFDLPVPLYVSENDEQPFDVITFKKQRDGVIIFKTNRITSLNPYQMSGGDSDREAKENIRMGLIRFPAVLTFRVLETANDFFRVVVNEKTFETVVIKKDPDYAVLPQRVLIGFPSIPKDRDYKGYYIYETWEHLLLRAEHLSFDIDFEMYDAPEGNVTYKGTRYNSLCYQATEVKSDWVKVRKARLLESYFEGIENAEGWVKWKNDKEILIRIVEFTVE